MSEVSNSVKEAINNNRDLSPIIFLLTAEDHKSLQDAAIKYLSFIRSTNHNLLDICYSLLTCNTFFSHKLIINCKNKQELCSLLEKFIAGNGKAKTANQLYYSSTPTYKPKMAYVFSGQGGQWFAMGKNLIANEPVFKNYIKKVDILLKDIAGWSLIAELSKNKTESLINKTEIVQPAIFAIQVGLVKLLEDYGISPEGVLGHSLGETTAAYSAGALSLKEAVYIIYHKSRIQAKQANSGKILAVNIGIDEAKKDIIDYGSRISIAAINGPNMLVIAGDAGSLEKLAKLYTKKGYFNRFVNAEVPYHSHYMNNLKQELITRLGNIALKPAIIPLYSTVSASQENGLHLTGEYWFKNARNPVLLTDTISKMIKDGFNLFTEVGPHPVLVEGIHSLFDTESYQGTCFSLMNRRFEDEINYYRQGLVRLIANNINLNIEKLLKWKGSGILLP